MRHTLGLEANSTYLTPTPLGLQARMQWKGDDWSRGFRQHDGMAKGWRSRIYHLSHDRTWVKHTAVGIVASGFVVALALVFLQGPGRTQGAGAFPDHIEQSRRAEWQALRHAEAPRLRALAWWLRLITAQMPHLAEVLELEPTTWEGYEKTGALLEYETRALLEKHAPESGPRALLEAFLQAKLSTHDAVRESGKNFIHVEAEAGRPLANELLAALRLRDADERGAMAALLREGSLHVDAQQAREDALRLALRLKDRAALREMRAQMGWLEGAPPALQHQAGAVLGDWWLQWRGLLLHRAQHLPYGALALAFGSCLVWYSVLVLHGGGTRRWLWPLVPLSVGIISVWPVLTLAAWQEQTNGLTPDAPFPLDVLYFVAGVGLREELGKLAAVALFIPWLLWRKLPGQALLTGAFVGLGFALEENINYYTEYGGAVVLVRFLTANFLHAALTGLVAQELYTVLRTRFARVEGFLITLPAVVVVHGLYDYAASSTVGGLDLLAMVLLAITAWHFLDVLAREAQPGRRWVSPGAVVVLGAACLIALSFIRTTTESPDRESLATAAQQCVAVLPLMFIYWRRLSE